MKAMTIVFSNGNRASAVRTPIGAAGAAIVEALGLPPPRAVLLLNGGASDMSSTEMARLHGLLVRGVARVVAEQGITVIDGGTQAGVMQMMGEGHTAAGGNSPLIGVCPAALVSWPGSSTDHDLIPLEPHHTHFVLTSGYRWGAETGTMFALATALSVRVSSLAILVNGGSIARQEMLFNVRQGREIIVIQGSGRLADLIAAIVGGDIEPPDDDIAAIVRDGRITVLNSTDGPEALAALIRQKLFDRLSV